VQDMDDADAGASAYPSWPSLSGLWVNAWRLTTDRRDFPGHESGVTPEGAVWLTAGRTCKIPTERYHRLGRAGESWASKPANSGSTPAHQWRRGLADRFVITGASMRMAGGRSLNILDSGPTARPRLSACKRRQPGLCDQGRRR
jgi:hypothetical protein